MTERLGRVPYALAVADVVKLRAACTRRQVACVILDDAGRIAATGYNGTPAGEVHCTDGGCPRGAFTHDQIPGLLGNHGHDVPCTARHAETNAAEWALEHGTDPATALVAITCPPCVDCAADLRYVGWGTVVWRNRDPFDGSLGGWGPGIPENAI